MLSLPLGYQKAQAVPFRLFFWTHFLSVFPWSLGDGVLDRWLSGCHGTAIVDHALEAQDHGPRALIHVFTLRYWDFEGRGRVSSQIQRRWNRWGTAWTSVCSKLGSLPKLETHLPRPYHSKTDVVTTEDALPACRRSYILLIKKLQTCTSTWPSTRSSV